MSRPGSSTGASSPLVIIRDLLLLGGRVSLQAMRGPRMALGFLAVLVLLSAGQVLEWFWIVPDGVRFPFEAMTSEGALYWSDVVEGTWGLHGSRVGAGLLGLGFHWLPAQCDVGPWFIGGARLPLRIALL